MSLRRVRPLVLFLCAVSLFSLIGLNGAGRIHAQDEADADGIPFNCENTASPHANVNLFPRYAAGENRLVLIDWSSGAVVRELESGLSDPVFRMTGWSPDCHYLTGGLGDGERFTTVIWDAANGGRVGSVEDAYSQPHRLTWSPRSDSVVVETRRGAFLWTLATGQRLQLTVNSWQGHSFSEIVWNYADGTLETLNMVFLPIIYSLETGRPVNYSLADGVYVGSASYSAISPSTVYAPTAASPYGCVYTSWVVGEYGFVRSAALPNIALRSGAGRLSFVDLSTGDIISVLASGLEDTPGVTRSPGMFSSDCEYVFTLHRTNNDAALPRTGFMWRVADGELMTTIEAIPRRIYLQYYEDYRRTDWDSSGRYFFVQTYNGAQVWDSETNRTMWLTTADESANQGHSISDLAWDSANHTITVTMRFSDEIRVFDLLTGARQS